MANIFYETSFMFMVKFYYCFFNIFLVILKVNALGSANIPPVPINKGFNDGISPYLLVSPAERKF